MRVSFLISILVILGSSCKSEEGNYLYFDDPPAERYSSRSYPIKDIFNNAKVDILWVIDNSGSMSSIQQNVINNTQIFIDNFTKGSTLDWRIGLMSTDSNEPPYIGFTTPLDTKTKFPVSVFQQAVSSLGTNGSYAEHVFYNINRGVIDLSFLRSDAHLAVIMVTDEDEQSAKDHGSLYQASTFLERMKAVVGSDNNLRFYGALDMDDLASCSNYNVEYAKSPFEEVINETGGFVISACVSNFGSKLADIGKDILTLVESPKIALTERPFVDSIEVLYRGKKLLGGINGVGYWYYDRYFNTINFYNLDFTETDLDNDDIQIDFQIDDGIDRDVE